MGVTTDCIIFTYEDWQLKVLLVRRGGEPYKGEWAFPGGFLKMNETAEQGALRELREETALVPSALVQLGVFSDVDRDPRERVITIAWYALVKPSGVVGGDDAEEAAWFPVDKLPHLAFDHRKIFDAAMERLRRDIHFQPVGFDLLDDEFTIPDLQRLYEAILGVKFDRRNFQRKIMSSGILESAPETEEASDSDMYYEPDFAQDSLPSASSVPELSCEKKSLNSDEYRKGRKGRHGILFRLNRRKYDELKEDGLKQEF
ncbi:MAG: NUDIX hydrolase [Bacteroidales bacterium]|nr:NUDIX hydrolase [Bacteroidales bacterium]